jgi:Zn-dependent protease with chaperone function
MTRYIILLSIVLFAHSAAGANPFAYMYDMRQLRREKPRYEQRVGDLYRSIVSLLTDHERRAIAAVRIELPLIGAQAGTPLDFYSMGRVGNAAVFMPVFSLLFLEDLAIAYAWLQRHDYSLETVEEYVTMLRYKKASDFAGGRYPPPLKALHIPPDAMSAEGAKTLALALRNEAYAFILLHELGHVLYRHPGYHVVPSELSRQHEAEADRFALTVLERADIIPMGMILWFVAQVNAMPSKGQLMAEKIVKSDADWQAYVKTWATYPVTVERLSAIVLSLNDWARRAGPGNQHDMLEVMASKLVSMADAFNDPALQGCIVVGARRADPALLAPRRNITGIGGNLMQAHCETRQ